MTRTEITEDMISRFMSGSLRAYDIGVDKYVDFTRMAALRFLDMVLNPPPVLPQEVFDAGLEELCRYSDRTGLLWKNMQAQNVLPWVYTAMKAAEVTPKSDKMIAHRRSTDTHKVGGEHTRWWHHRGSDHVATDPMRCSVLHYDHRGVYHHRAGEAVGTGRHRRAGERL